MAIVGGVADGSDFEAYLQIEGIPGDAAEARHQDWIRVNGFRDRTAASPAGRSPVFDPLCFTKTLDRATPVLFQRCADGTHLPRARLELVTAEKDRVRFYAITLSNVRITGVQASGTVADAAAPPDEEVCLDFSGIEWTYTEFDRSGLPATEIRAWWDRVSGSGNVATVPVFKVTGV